VKTGVFKNRLKFAIKKLIYKTAFAKNLFMKLKFDPVFSGWGMSTSHYPPWDSNSFPTNDCADFVKISDRIASEVRSGKMKLMQFVDYNTQEILSELMWRHFIIFWSVRHIAKNSKAEKRAVTLAECGVCDGLTLRFAIESADLAGLDYKAFGYDAWSGMREDLLSEGEKKYTGNYSNIVLRNTMCNLDKYKDDIVFIKGYIPESFSLQKNPVAVDWLHIDLNSSKSTKSALEFFYEKIRPGGVIIFDDYGWHGYTESKRVIDEFFSGKYGNLLPLPTGQALYFK